jgi:predicted ATPase/class 3 adenylate cyclase
MRSELPSGTVTVLFTDVEGSTKLLHELGAKGYAEALAEHRRVIREACARHDGVEVDTQGDAFFVAFPTAPGALAAAEEMTRELASGPIQVRIGLHTGTPLLTAEGYVGGDVHRAARIAAAGHGGQVLVSASTAPLVETKLSDLGEHRFKDLSAPERVYQLGDGDFPALKSLYRTNLPVPTTPFLGRERELAEVVGLLEGTRLLTLTGPGGTGKTRLAAQAAGMAGDGYPDGVWWVPLAPLRDPALVVETAAQVVGSENGLAEHVASKSMLLLFDNFEQVVAAAGDIAGLLGSCPNLHLLVTSREPLHVTGEQEYPVPPLVHEEGVGFFLSRARAVKPDFQPDDAVSDICRRLDDLPLALELAAARVKALSSSQILNRLEQRLPLLTGGARDLPERQRTLRGAIEWSYDLLNDDEQRLFARLSVFRGGCALEAAEAICEADLDTLQSLVDKSLLRHSGERYWMLETIREYATDRLEEMDDADEIRRRRAELFLSLAESLPVDVGVSREWLDRLETEHDNVRATLDDLAAAGETQLVLRLAGALWRLWSVRGYHREGMRRLDEALLSDDSATAARARALIGASSMAVGVKEFERARHFADEALDLYRGFEDGWGIARAIFFQGYVAIESGDFAQARPSFEECLHRFTELDAKHDVQLVLFNLSWACGELGDHQRARDLAEECLQRARTFGSRRDVAFALDLLSSHARDDGRLEEALEAALEGLRIRRDEGDVEHQLDGLSRMALIYARAARVDTGATLLSSSVHLHEELGMLVPLYQEKRNEETLHIFQEELDEAAFEKAWEDGRKLTLDEAVALALRGADADFQT